MTPDPAFAGGDLGPGVAIDPVVGEVVAPFDGVVVSLHAARHAVVVRHAAGPQILTHVGIDTVTLAGRGFEALVKPGDVVRGGQALIRFDLDAVVRAAPSLVSPIVLIESEGFGLEAERTDVEVAAGGPLFRLRRAGRAAAGPEATAKTATVERRLTIALANGLHARPATALTRLARARGAEGLLVLDDGRAADLRSPVAVMALGVRMGDTLTLRVSGPQREAAARALATLLEGGFEEIRETARSPRQEPASEPEARVGEIVGTCGSPGVAIGLTYCWSATPADADRNAGSPATEAFRLDAALGQAAADLATEAAWSGAAPVLSAILEAHLGLVEDLELRRDARRRIDDGTPAGAAWSAATRRFSAALEASGDARLAGRAADLRDIQARVLRALAGDDEAAAAWATPPAGAILLARDLPPSSVKPLAAAGVAGICLAESGPTAHVALIAAALGLPMLVAAGHALMSVAEGRTMRLDATSGRLSPACAEAPDTPELRATTRKALRATEPAFTIDGARVTVLANLGAADEVSAAVAFGAEGCGLLRTEFLFMDHAGPPSEAAQLVEYRRVLEGLGGRPLVIRTLDIGADKSAPWLPFPREPNPALGRRGVRVSLARPDLLGVQLRAIASLPPEADVSIMAPMVTRLAEVRAVRVALDEACRAVGRTAPLRLGVMVETPAAALIADRLAAETDFLSIGANDLAQYVLAADRGGSDADAFDPAVLRAIAMIVAGAARHGRQMSVCGALASDPRGVTLLVGLGVRRLSCAPAAIPRLKGLVRQLEAAACRDVAEQALEADSAAEVRALAADATPQINEGR